MTLPFTYSLRKNNVGCIPFLNILVCEMQIASSKIWTLIAVSIFYNNNHYNTCVSVWIQRVKNLTFLPCFIYQQLHRKESDETFHMMIVSSVPLLIHEILISFRFFPALLVSIWAFFDLSNIFKQFYSYLITI